MPVIILFNLFYYGHMLTDNVIYGKDTCEILTLFFGKKSEEENECDQDDAAPDCTEREEQCKVLPGGVFKGLLILTPVIIVTNVHFMFVLLTHYKNSGLPEADGGCPGDQKEVVEFDMEE